MMTIPERPLFARVALVRPQSVRLVSPIGAKSSSIESCYLAHLAEDVFACGSDGWKDTSAKSVLTTFD